MECENFITPSSSRQSVASDRIVNLEDVELSQLNTFTDEPILKKKYLDVSWQERRNVDRGSIVTTWRGPLRAFRLLILVALMPALFIAIPLYLRYHVFSGQLYPVGMSDMRMIDRKMSTTWCQRQLVRSNATFNAFLMSSQPSLAREQVPLSMVRQLSLEDDMKEYWGFYLLQGSTVTVSTCVRWPGASLIMIRGHRHLQQCAYIGDDSSEELEELLKVAGIANSTLAKLLVDQPANRPKEMTRHLSGVKFHEPRPPALNTDSAEQFHISEEKDTLDSQVLNKILIQLKSKQEMKKKNRDPASRPRNIVAIPQLNHRYRETNVNEKEEQFFVFKDLEKTGDNDGNKRDSDKTTVGKENSSRRNSKANKEFLILKQIGESSYDDKEVGNTKREDEVSTVFVEDRFNETNVKDNIAEPRAVESSSEIFDAIFNKLSSLGVRGQNVLHKLNDKLSNNTNSDTSHILTKIGNNVTKDLIDDEDKIEELNEDMIADSKIETLKKLLMDILEEQEKNKQLRKKDTKNDRKKRELIIEQKLQELNEDDEKGNAAIEDGFEPDGIADHHMRLNETTLNDMSRSEFWSSFSSSEEALLECDGLILNLPLTPHSRCEHSSASADKHDDISRANTVTYKVPTNGYYFFVFNSENEIQTNYIRVRFDLKKTIYDLSEGMLMECKNSTSECFMPLAFFSEEKVVLEVPVRDNDSLWNEDFVVTSECEPRTAIYIVCVIAVPLLIILMAFQ